MAVLRTKRTSKDKEDSPALVPLQLRAPIQRAHIPQLPSKSEAMTLVNRFARTELSEEDVFIFPTVPSTDALDSYFWRQTIQSLENFAKDASLGIAIMNSHRTGGFGKLTELPMGRSFFGRVVPAQGLYEDVVAGDLGQATFAVLSAAYMLRDHTPNDVNTNEIIRGIEGGTIFDLSVTFIPELARCELCNEDYYDYFACPHIPGVDYDEGLCTIASENAHIIEYSTVFDGATPGSTILKAEFAAERGMLNRVQVGMLEERYKTLITPRKTLTVEEGIMAAKKDKAPPDNEDSKVRLSDADLEAEKIAAADNEDPPEEDPPEEEHETSTETVDAEERSREGSTDDEEEEEASRDTSTEVQELAEIGRTYLVQLRKSVLESGTRALGTKFPRSLWEGLTQKMSVIELETAKADFDQQARTTLGKGGRQTAPLDPDDASGGEDTDNENEPQSNRFPALYKA